MNDRLKVPAFLLIVLAVFALAFLAGTVIDLDEDSARESHGNPHEHGKKKEKDRGHGHGPKASADFSLNLIGDKQAPAGRRTLRFEIVDGDGEPVTAYDERHERDLHLIVVEKRDPRIYQHVHPKLGSDGVWSVALDLGPGSYRMYADTQPSGAEPVVLTRDIGALGHHRPKRDALSEPAATAKVDGFTVRLAEAGDMLAFAVERAGKPVELEPYLGAGGHLVVIGAPDLSYLHAHPMEGTEQPIGFRVEFDEPGRYVLHFDFQVEGVVRTATFIYDKHAEASQMPTEEMSGHEH